MTNYKLHTILINKRISLNDSKKWIIKHGYKIPHKGVHITTNYYRFRQISPETLIKNGFTIPKTIKINDDIYFVLYYK